MTTGGTIRCIMPSQKLVSAVSCVHNLSTCPLQVDMVECWLTQQPEEDPVASTAGSVLDR